LNTGRRTTTVDVWGQDAESVLESASDCEQVVLISDPASGLEGVIAVHSTVLGPALGGLRFQSYPSRAAAMADALHLAKGMTYKAAMAGLDLGGGKAVINGDPAKLRSERLLRAFGRHVEALGGRYVTAEDVGTTEADMAMVARETRWVTGLATGLGGSGDPSGSTAKGVFAAIEAAVEAQFGSPVLDGRSVCVLGVGKVGGRLAELLVQAGAVVRVADVHTAAVADLVQRLPVTALSPDAALSAEVDVLSPCALGGLLDQQSIPALRCAAVAGAANNQLADAACGELLRQRDIVYVPDFVANAGGIIQLASELSGGTPESVADQIAALRGRVTDVLQRARVQGVSTHRAAEELAEQRMRDIGALQSVRLPASSRGRS